MGWAGVLCISVWLWKPEILPYQWMLQSGVCFVIILLCWRPTLLAVPPRIILLDDDGSMSLPLSNEKQWQVNSKSRTLGPFVYLVVNDRFDKNDIFTLWLARDQVYQSDFCRLCKVIIRCQSSFTHQRSTGPSELKH